ncbi:MAG TPA: InlB B-repeat-containing protein, partial [Fodinibius sp.]|nr:InlB B-repeat-containing protein [Fodinibius sp.]
MAGVIFLYGCDDNSSGTNNNKTYDVALEANPSAGGEVSPAYGNYEAGKELEITASPSDGYRFEKWSADYEGTNKKATITVDINKKIVANFARKEYDLTVDTTGKGSVNETPLKFKSTSYTGGTRVQLSAHPETGWMFDHWEGDLSGSENPEVITVEGPSQVTAVFVPAEYELTVNAEHGAVDQEVIKSKSYAKGTMVKLTANPDQGYIFDHWEGDLSGTDNPETITMNTAK